MTELNVHIITFNCGRREVNVDYFASSLYSSFKTPGTLPPDLLVFALQEIAPIAYSFLGGSLLAPSFTSLASAVSLATEWSFGNASSYERVLTRHVGMTAIMVFARKNVLEQIRWIEAAGTGVGLWEMGNKGAVGVRLGIGEEDAIVTFVAAHLAPMEDGLERRNEDWRNICSRLVFETVSANDRVDRLKSNPEDADENEPLLSTSHGSGKSEPQGLFSPPSYIFFAGDLNYRTSDTAPGADAFSTWPQPMVPDSDPSHYANLLKHDQLTQQLARKRTLHNLAEAPIHFPPTYKYSSRAQKLAAETAKANTSKPLPEARSSSAPKDLAQSQEQVWLWAKHRVPSWCDRILFLASAPPTVHQYAALPVQPTSDHRPVVLSCKIPRQPLKPVQVASDTQFEIVKDWKQKRAAVRRLEYVIGIAAYLGLTGQGEALLAGTVVGIIVGYLALQRILIGNGT